MLVSEYKRQSRAIRRLIRDPSIDKFDDFGKYFVQDRVRGYEHRHYIIRDAGNSTTIAKVYPRKKMIKFYDSAPFKLYIRNWTTLAKNGESDVNTTRHYDCELRGFRIGYHNALAMRRFTWPGTITLDMGDEEITRSYAYNYLYQWLPRSLRRQMPDSLSSNVQMFSVTLGAQEEQVNRVQHVESNMWAETSRASTSDDTDDDYDEDYF